MTRCNTVKLLSILFVNSLIFAECKTPKQLAYFQDLPKDQATSLNTTPYQPLKLQTNDEVQINISSPSSEASQLFNLGAMAPSTNGSPNEIGGINSGLINLYRVSSTGKITLPILGEVNAAGLTTEELKVLISQKLSGYLKQAVVTVNLTNFKVTVIGEVTRPIVVPVNGQAINVLEAIGASGDLTVYGIRNNVRVIRKLPNGKTEIAVLDFNNSSVMMSPYFQLQQNDIVYVQPNKNKGILGTRSNILIPIFSGIASIITLILVRRF